MARLPVGRAILQRSTSGFIPWHADCHLLIVAVRERKIWEIIISIHVPLPNRKVGILQGGAWDNAPMAPAQLHLSDYFLIRIKKSACKDDSMCWLGSTSKAITKRSPITLTTHVPGFGTLFSESKERNFRSGSLVTSCMAVTVWHASSRRARQDYRTTSVHGVPPMFLILSAMSIACIYQARLRSRHRSRNVSQIHHPLVCTIS